MKACLCLVVGLVMSCAARPLRPAPQLILAWDAAPAAAFYVMAFTPVGVDPTNALTQGQGSWTNQMTIELPPARGVTYSFAVKLIDIDGVWSLYSRPVRARTADRPRKRQPWIPAQR